LVGLIVFIAIGAAKVGQNVPAPDAENASLLVVFLTGLFAGGLTCLAIQGGLLATAVAQRVDEDVPGTGVLAGKAAPILMFVGAKLVAYTVLGALLGLFGSFIELTPTLQGWLQIAMGLIMVGVAGQLLNLHPVSRYFSLQPPKAIQRLIRRESRSGRLMTPALLGALTVFIPCGTTQAMMLVAMASGSPVSGALVLVAFVLATIPL